MTKSFWGYETTEHVTDIDTYGVTTFFPLNGVESIADVKEKYTFPDPDWFDYASLKEQCDRYPDKALIMGHEGPFQIVTYLIEMDQFFMLMVDEPETAKYILDKMVEFELEYYRRCFEAVPGRIDILRPHDDYGRRFPFFSAWICGGNSFRKTRKSWCASPTAMAPSISSIPAERWDR